MPRIRNSFLVLQFDFSSVQAGTLAEIEARFTKHVRECVTSFAVKYAKLADRSRVENTTTAAAEKGKVLGRSTPDAETVEQALAYRKALARRPDWDHPIHVAVVEVCGNSGYNWFDLYREMFSPIFRVRNSFAVVVMGGKATVNEEVLYHPRLRARTGAGRVVVRD